MLLNAYESLSVLIENSLLNGARLTKPLEGEIGFNATGFDGTVGFFTGLFVGVVRGFGLEAVGFSGAVGLEAVVGLTGVLGLEAVVGLMGVDCLAGVVGLDKGFGFEGNVADDLVGDKAGLEVVV